MKIMVVVGAYPPEELARRQRAIERAASPGTEIVLGTIEGTVFRRSAAEVHHYVAATAVAAIAQEAERDGLDAVVPFGTLDIGVELARHLVRIPVVGAAQTSLHLAATLSRRIGIVVYERATIPFFRKQASAWGLGDFVASYQTTEIPLVDSATSHDRMRDQFLAAARAAMAEGAELIIPMGVTTVPVHYAAAEMSDALGIPVLDALAVSIQTAELMVRTGLRHSPLSYPPVTAL